MEIAIKCRGLVQTRLKEASSSRASKFFDKPRPGNGICYDLDPVLRMLFEQAVRFHMLPVPFFVWFSRRHHFGWPKLF